MYLFRFLAIALVTALSLLAGCGNKSSTQTPPTKNEGAKPAQSASSDYDQILSGMRSIVARQLSLDASAIDVDAPLSKLKVGADELDAVEIIMSAEERFGVEIKDEEVSNPEGHMMNDLSVRKLADIVARKKRG